MTRSADDKVARFAEAAKMYPDLAYRALEMERRANLKSIQGLGRSFSWSAYLAADEAQQRLFPEVIEEPCMCWDGSCE